MKRLLLLVLLAASLPASARVNWMWLGADQRADVFVDNAGVMHPRGYLKVWTLLSYKSRQRGGWLSEKRLFLYSCKEHRLDWQQSMYYTNPMGEGDLLLARTLNRYGVGDLLLEELDPSTRDKRYYRKAVPESAFLSAFDSMC